jgi:hypothetical protein
MRSVSDAELEFECRLSKKFEKLLPAGGETNTKTWSSFSPAERRLLLAKMELLPNERPLIGMLEHKSRLLLTTKRIVWDAANSYHSIEIGKLDDVKAPDSKRVDKLDLHRLVLTTVTGEEYVLEVTPGTNCDFSGSIDHLSR